MFGLIYLQPSKVMQTETHVAIEAFTHKRISGEFTLSSINHPRNAMNLQSDAYDSYNKMQWAIEAVCQEDGRVSGIS